jgi:guanidinobutyrase
VSPPFDTTGTTALTAANLLFEMLCVLPGVPHAPPKPLHGFTI